MTYTGDVSVGGPAQTRQVPGLAITKVAVGYDAGGELADQPHLFTGDSLFPGGPGNTDHDPDRFGALITDLENRVFADLPDGTWVYPGHGSDTTIGTERP